MLHSIFKSSIIISFIVFSLLISPQVSQASFIGDEISLSSSVSTGFGSSPKYAVIGDDVEFIGVNNHIAFDFGSDTLNVFSLWNALIGFSGYGTYTFTGFDTEITSFEIISNSGFTGSLVDNYYFDSGGISLIMSTSFRPGSVLTFGINQAPAPVPEPSTFLLLGSGLAGLVFVARRRRKE